MSTGVFEAPVDWLKVVACHLTVFRSYSTFCLFLYFYIQYVAVMLQELDVRLEQAILTDIVQARETTPNLAVNVPSRPRCNTSSAGFRFLGFRATEKAKSVFFCHIGVLWRESCEDLPYPLLYRTRHGTVYCGPYGLPTVVAGRLQHQSRGSYSVASYRGRGFCSTDGCRRETTRKRQGKRCLCRRRCVG